ncbi:MAG: ATP-grasp domain-containing protein [Candidatus Omnitrophica bacterium]|nr:ATP-grasp domain-containing protein [Candidatus Omnitrophota bacterium]
MAKNHKNRVGLTYDLRTDYIFKPGDPPDINAEFDHPSTIDMIADAIESGGHTAVKVGNVDNLLKSLDGLDVDIVFNICEGMHGRNRESQVPMLLELRGIPFVGADPLSLGITLDKIITKKILKSHGIETPAYIEIKDSRNLNGLGLNFPLIVKPRFEGSSKGLNDNSLVKNRQGLLKQSKWLIEKYNQPAIAEEFISGEEFTIGIIGNKDPKPFPVVQVEIDGSLSLNNLFYTFSRIHSDAIRYVCPAPISKRLSKQLQNLAVATYEATECLDFSRVDIRVDKNGKPYVLEINPLPSLSTADVFGIVGKHLGVGYNRMVLDVLDAAIKRYGI